MMNPDFLYGLIGGCLIGAGSLLALIATQKIPGISGVFGRLLQSGVKDPGWRVAFLLGLIGGAFALFQTSAAAAAAAEFRVPEGRGWLSFVIAGCLVGFGTRLGGGCTSGHGVCGMGMGARDSIVATILFMAAAMITVLLVNLWLVG